jgi:hypothetical protein
MPHLQGRPRHRAAGECRTAAVPQHLQHARKTLQVSVCFQAAFGTDCPVPGAASPMQVRWLHPLRAPGVLGRVALSHQFGSLRAVPPALPVFARVRPQHPGRVVHSAVPRR